VAAKAAASKTGTDTLVLDVGDIIGITDYFVITSGANARQVKTIAEEIERQMKDLGVRPTQTEGRSDATWVLLDFGGFIVHVFLQETRDYYGLERLWGDAPGIDWDDATAAVS
jgi:ribosome-associated protein